MGKVKPKKVKKVKKVAKKVTKKKSRAKGNEPTPAPIDVIKLLEQSDKAKLKRKAQRLEQREEHGEQVKKSTTVRTGLKKVHDKEGNGSRVVDQHGKTVSVTAPIPNSLIGDFKDLKAAKLACKEESKNHRNHIFLNVQSDGSFNVSTRWAMAESLHCFKNGAEVPMYRPSFKSDVQKEVEEMGTTSKTKSPAKKVAGKVPAKKTAKPVLTGGKDMTVKEILALLKKGTKVLNKKGKLFNANKLGGKSPDLVRKAFVQK